MRRFDFVKDYEKLGYEFKQLPQRGTKNSAGYDIYSPLTVNIAPHSAVFIPTGVKAHMNENEVLQVFVRSSVGIKRHLMLANTVGIIDSDYADNPENDGNIGLKLYNYGDEPVVIHEGERVAQGIFVKYLTTDDDDTMTIRIGGTGSTGK